MSLTRALVLNRSGVTLFALWTFFACGGRDNAEVYSSDGGLLSCGNGQLDLEEDCDGEAMGEVRTCEDAMIPGATGTLRCAKNCTLDTSACRGPGPGTGGRGTAGMMNVGGGGTTGFGGQNVGGTMAGIGGRNQGGGGTTGIGGRNQGGGGTTGMGGRRGGGTGGAPQAGGRTSTGGGPQTDAGPVADAGPTCAGSGDCGSGQVCCGTISGGQYTGFACQPSCGTNDTVIDCSTPSDCGTGQICCGTLQTGQNTHYTSISCQATCDQAQNEYIQCASNADCTNGLTCQGSQFLPAQFRVCR